MQLKDPKGGALAAAAITLLGGAAPPAAADDTQRWEFDSAMLLYTEGSGRVFCFEPKLAGSYDLHNDRKLSAGLTIDVLSGPSPSGAAPASTPQTFTQPSGDLSYTVAPGEQPLDPSFKDTRIAGDLGYEMPLGESNKVGVHGSAATEYDYRSLSGGASLSHDFALKNTTISGGFNYASDTLHPVGGAPTPFAVKTGGGGGGDESKQVIDGLVGITQVLSPVSLAEFNYSLSYSTGYLTDPYKILSVVDSNAEPLRYVFESRPDTRTKHAAFVEYKRFVFNRDVWEVSYRFMTDDWGVVSHTIDTTHRWNFSSTNYLEPHLRWYRQSAADFYVAALDDGQEHQVEHASADPRLGAFDGLTGGLKYGHTFWGDMQWSARLEYYKQIGRTEGLPPEAGAAMSKFDLKPDLDVVMLTLGLKFRY